MAPISPISRKRSPPSDGDDSLATDTPSKRRRTGSNLSQVPQSDELSLPLCPEVELFDEKPRKLLSRAVALALEHVGFDAASQEALEAMCAEVDTC
jgi:transcription initiation factor TFIID subunit 8